MELERNKSGGIAFVNEQQMGVGDIIPNGHSCSLLSILCKWDHFLKDLIYLTKILSNLT